jgi:hypothetical protein
MLPLCEIKLPAASKHILVLITPKVSPNARFVALAPSSTYINPQPFLSLQQDKQDKKP